jgi:hypothetical protein
MGAPNQFITCVKWVINENKQQGLKEAYDKLVETMKECTNKP